MIKKIKYLMYGINYLIQTKIFRREIPDLSYKNIERGLKIFFDKGIRSVFIEGGEPFLWKEDGRNLDDVIKLARNIGFKVISIYTNGTFSIRTSRV